MGHFGFRWVSDPAYQSPMKHVQFSDGSPTRHIGLRSGISVSDENPIENVGLHWVFDNNNIFVNMQPHYLGVHLAVVDM